MNNFNKYNHFLPLATAVTIPPTTWSGFRFSVIRSMAADATGTIFPLAAFTMRRIWDFGGDPEA